MSRLLVKGNCGAWFTFRARFGASAKRKHCRAPLTNGNILFSGSRKVVKMKEQLGGHKD